MRLYLAQVETSYSDRLEQGTTLVWEGKRTRWTEKGVIQPFQIVNIDTGDITTLADVVGLGYADFKDEDDRKERLPRVIHHKLVELELQRLESNRIPS
jgi:hypothetical protein